MPVPDQTAAPAPIEVSLVICTMNEADSIAPVIAEAQGALGDLRHEIIIVDDSPDERTADVVRTCAAKDSRIRLVRREGVRGLASACIAGWDAAQGQILGVMDGDGQHEAGLLPRMVAALRAENADLVIASRYVHDREIGLTGFRRALSIFGVWLSRIVIGAATTDPLAGFFMLRRDWFNQVRPRLSGVGFKILVDVLAGGKRTPKVAEVATKLRPRIAGASKLDLRIMVELAAQLIETRSGRVIPSRFVMFAGVGLTGVVVHTSILGTLDALGAPFWAAQACAISVAMVSNYALNNLLTFRDLRLTGRAWWRGLAGFALACSSGAVISELVAIGLTHLHAHRLVAGVMGAVVASLWNYWSASRAAWGVAPKGRDAAQGEAVRKAAKTEAAEPSA